MKYILIAAFCAFGFSATAQTGKEDPKKRTDTLEVSCGQCNFKLKTQKGCDLAVRIGDKAWFVDGTRIDDHGDAHADDGFCNKVRKALVQGEVVGDRFKVTYFKLLPEEKAKKN